MRRLSRMAGLFFIAANAAKAGENVTVARSGWFSDEACASGRVNGGAIGATNRDCAQKCLAKGARMVFIDEKARTLYFVENPGAAKGQESHYVQVTGMLDATSKTLRVASVKVLETYKATCQVPK